MEDDIDIYEDLPSFETKQNENVIGSNDKDISYEQIELKKQIAELTIKLEDFQRINKNLEVNLISLLKTAKAEIARKDMVIDDLRKKLDDVTFKRGVYSKVNEGVVRNSTLRNAVINNHYESTGSCFPLEENKFEAADIDFSCGQIKEQQSKSMLTPITVFGERLRKRIIDEQNLEKKEKFNSKDNSTNNNNNSSSNSNSNSNSNNNNNSNNNSNNNNNNNNNNSNGSREGAERYVGESDKENGSFDGTNFCNAKNVQPSTAVQCVEKECTKNPLNTSRTMTKDSESEDKSKIDTKLERITAASVKYMGKRTREETNKQISVKRMKCEDGKRFTELTRKENNDNAHDAFEEMTDALEYTRIEGSGNFSKKRPTLQALDTVYGYKSTSRKTNKHRHDVIEEDGSSKNDERKGSKKEKDAFCNNRFVNGRFSKRENKPAENFPSKSEQRFTSNRCPKTFKRDTHRSNVEERRDKRYAVSTLDRRSVRVRDTILHEKCQEEKYGKSQHVKHSIDHGDRFEKHHDHRGTDPDKSKPVNKELCGIRNTKKRSCVDRKVNGLKKTDRYEEYNEWRKLRNADKTTFIGKLEREKQNECNEQNSHRRLGVERSRERARDCETSIRNEKKNDCFVAVGQGDRINETNDKEFRRNGKGRVGSESKKRANESEDSLSSDLEEGEIENSREKPNREKRSKEVRNGESCDLREPIIDELVERTKVPLDGEVVPQHCSLVNSNVHDTHSIAVARTEGSIDPESGRVNESMEIVENVENIEKFIREQASSDRNVDERALEPASETSRSVNGNLQEKMLITSEGGVREKSNTIDISAYRDADISSNLVEKTEQRYEQEQEHEHEHEHEYENENEKDKTNKTEGSSGGPENTCSSLSERENFVDKNDPVEPRTSQLEHKKASLDHGTTTTLNFIGLPNNDYSSTNATKEEQLSKVDHRPPENIAKDDLLLVLDSKSPYPRSPAVGSLSGSSRKTASNEDYVTIDSVVQGNDDIARDHNQHDRDENNEKGIDRKDRADGVNTEKQRLNVITATGIVTADATKSEQAEEMNGEKSITKEENEAAKNGLNEPEKSTIRKSENASTKLASSNVHGKIIVFVRRKKPVRLVDNNANMTVLINSKKHKVNAVDSSSDRITSNATHRCTNSSLNKTRTSDREAKKAS